MVQDTLNCPAGLEFARVMESCADKFAAVLYSDWVRSRLRLYLLLIEYQFYN
jgi:hypothetical protein